MLSIRSTLLLACALFAAVPLASQTAGPGARMRAFLRASRDYAMYEQMSAFLPRRGDVTWVLTTSPARDPRVGEWRFAPADVPRAMEGGGPLCETFSHGGDVIVPGTLMYHVHDDERTWRRVAGNRFVPPGASAASPTFVEWRREDGRWVISAFGDERRTGPYVLGGWGERPNTATRDSVRGPPLALPFPAGTRYAAGAAWYEQNEPIWVDGETFIKYGLPRMMDAGSVRRVGTLDGVGLYVEMGTTGFADIVYVPVSPEGLFSPYMQMSGNGCN